MKKILFFLILIPAISIGQSPCKAAVSTDPFEGVKSVSKKTQLSAQEMNGSRLMFALTKFSKGEETEFLATFHGRTYMKGCVAEGKTKVVVLYSDGDKSELFYTGSVDCGIYWVSVSVPLEELEKLETKTATQVRLNYSDGVDDFKVADKWQPKLQETVRCVRSVN